jgi:NAD(P)-dependent dehydrogenase (short-subunit alcohol dehydrogenase family)
MSGAPFSGGDVLITQGRLRGMGGSEMISLEMAEHFAAAGSKVVVVARSIDAGIASMFTAIPGVEVREPSWSGLDDRLTSVPFSLVWVHHNVVPDAVLRGAVDAPVVFAHLSASSPAEAPLVPGLEAALASAVVFNSPETKDAQVSQGLFEHVAQERLHVFPNPAPDPFADVTDRTPGDRPRLLVVSNHIPMDLHRALEQVRNTFDVTLVGQQTELGAAPQRVGPDLVAEHDAVVSIGKTVQYALVAGRAIFCYDRFGGPGWLDKDNVDRAASTNFSGRGFDKRSPGVLAKELVEGWETGATFARAYRGTAAQRYQLSNALQDLEAKVVTVGPPPGGVGRDVAATTLLLERLLRSTTVTKDKAVAEYKAANAQLAALTSERDALRTELDAHRRSRAYRLVQRYRRVRRAVLGRAARR